MTDLNQNAKRIVDEAVTSIYTIKITADALDGGYIAECLELPGCMSQGETQAKALENIADAIRAVLAASDKT